MKKLTLLAFLGFIPVLLSAQSTGLGSAPFGSYTNGNFDAVNNENLNVFFSIPLVSSKGRGMPLGLSLDYNSLIWQKVNNSWTPVTDATGNPTWGWQKDFPSGSVSYTTTTNQTKCFQGSQWYWATITYYSNYVYTDVLGTTHGFPTVSFHIDNCPTQNGSGGTQTGYAGDATGYYLDATSPGVPKVTSVRGIELLGGNSSTSVDTNGNYVTKTNVSCSGCVETDWTDSVGNKALKIIYTPNTTSPTSITYQFLDGSGNYQTITLKLQQYNIKTNFGCGVSEYTGSPNLPYELDIPSPVSGTLKYSFFYEGTPGNTGYYTGRLQQVTLPTGGSYKYTYSTTNDGINCSDGTTLSFNRIVNDNSNPPLTWNFVSNTTTLTTTVTTPALPDIPNAFDTVYTFNSSGQELSRSIYADSPGKTLLRTFNTTWATNGTPSGQTTILENGTTQSTISTTYDSNGLLQSVTENDWGSSSAPGGAIRTTTYSYQTSTNYTSRNILDLVTSTVIKDGNGTTQYRQDVAYDVYNNNTLASCPTGIPQHDDTNYSCTTIYRGNPTSVTTYLSPATQGSPITKNLTFDWFGNLLTAQSNGSTYLSRSFSANTQYSQPDSVTKGISPTQLAMNYTYNLNLGLVTQATDPNSLVTNYSYDFLRRPKSIAQVGGGSVSYAYDDTAFTTTTTTTIDSSNSVKEVAQADGLGRITSSTTEDINGNPFSITSVKYDLVGRAYQTSNPYTGSPQYWTITNFDVLGRTKSVSFPDSSATSYTYQIQTVNSYTTESATFKDPAGKLRLFQNDATGRLVTVAEPDSSNTLNLYTSYAYNVLDELTNVTQGSQTRTYAYDALGRLFTTTTPESGTVCFGTVASGSCSANTGYDNFNNLLYRTDARGVLTSYGYDGLNRLTTLGYNVGSSGVPATPSVSYTYGSSSCTTAHGAGCIGQLITMTDGVGSENYTYNALEQMTQEQKVINGITFTTSYLYNFANELTKITYPSGRVVQQSIDPIGRPCEFAPSTTGCGTASSPYATGYLYNTAGLVTDFKYGNGIYASVGFSPDRIQLNCLDYSTTNRNRTCTHDGTTKFGLTYSYGTAGSNNGQIASITDYAEPGRSVTYTYDTLARLSTAISTGSTNYPQWGLQESYDRYGNRPGQTIIKGCVAPMTCPQTSVTIDPNNTNRISGDCYDANGNLLGETAPPCPSPTYTYDAENRLVRYMSSNPTYVYDGSGLRVQKCQPNCVSPTSSTVYIFVGSKVIAEYDNGAAPGYPSREYVYGAGTLLAKIDSSGTKYYHQDHLSNRLVTDSSANSYAQMGHFPFGEMWYNATNDKLLFTSYERDSDSFNDYAIRRYNISRLGRFSSPDPLPGNILNPQSLNRYIYALNDPCNLVDPLGLKCKLTIGLTGPPLNDAVKQNISAIFNDAGVDVEFVSGNGDLNIQQNVPVDKGYGQANIPSGTAFIDNPAIFVKAASSNSDNGLQVADTALSKIMTHELGHLATGCMHPTPKNPNPANNCGDHGIMRSGNDQADAFLDPKFQSDSPKNQFTKAQKQQIQDTCKEKEKKRNKQGGAGGNFTPPSYHYENYCSSIDSWVTRFGSEGSFLIWLCTSNN